MPREKGRHCNRSIVFGGWAEAAFWRVRAPGRARECRHVLGQSGKPELAACSLQPALENRCLLRGQRVRSYFHFSLALPTFKFYFLLV